MSELRINEHQAGYLDSMLSEGYTSEKKPRNRRTSKGTKDPENPLTKVSDDYEVKDVYEWLKEVIPAISMIGNYSGYTEDRMMDSDTPFDQFDSLCHQVGQGIATPINKYLCDDEEELMLLIATSKHVGKPRDMLMFLGEYFKKSVEETLKAHKNEEDQGRFYISKDIISYLGAACQMYIDKLRQELRISIALYRQPTFNDIKNTKEALARNIQDL